MSKNLLLTGGVGFIGHHTIEHLMENTDWNIVVLDRITYAGNINHVTDMLNWNKYKHRISYVYHDFRAEINESVHNLIKYRFGDLDYIVHMGAESHVDNSIEDPLLFAHSNVIGTVNMLEYARKYYPDNRFLYISTDEVYGASIDGHLHKEGEPHRPSNPYSASKSGGEAFCYAYYNTYGIDIVTTNTMNNFGERQNREKFLPRVIRTAVYGDTLKLHCKFEDGEVVDVSSRCWLHAKNHADGMLFVLRHGKAGESYNITGEKYSVKEVADMVADILDVEMKYDYEDFHSFRKGHDMHYGLDGTKLKKMGWVAPHTFRESLENTVNWATINKRWL